MASRFQYHYPILAKAFPFTDAVVVIVHNEKEANGKSVQLYTPIKH